MENMVNVYFFGKKYTVPADLTIMTAMEYAGYTLKRGCGCRHGFCGACATIYRIKGDNELKTCLACQTQVQEGMYVASIPFFPTDKRLYNIEDLQPNQQVMMELYPEIYSCIGCNACLKNGKCFREDGVNEFVEKAKTADGFVFGSPVHYASASGMITSFLDRAFYGKSALFQGKPGACIVSCRRGGASAAFDQLNKYFTINCMPVVSSQYWNQVHGNTPEEVKQDLEGMQTMRTLGNNMAWLLKCIAAGKAAGVDFPEREPAQKTNFIR